MNTINRYNIDTSVFDQSNSKNTVFMQVSISITLCNDTNICLLEQTT